MSTIASTGSPAQRRSSVVSVVKSSSPEDTKACIVEPPMIAIQDSGSAISLKKSDTVLSTSKLINQSAPKLEHDNITATASYPMDKLLAKLTEQQSLLQRQNDSSKGSVEDIGFIRNMSYQSMSSSLPMTPAEDTLPVSAESNRPASVTPTESQAASNEVLRLKLELAQAQTKISVLDQELAHTRMSHQDSGCTASGFGSGLDFTGVSNASPVNSRFAGAASTFLALPRINFSRDGIWAGQEEYSPGTSEILPSGTFTRGRGGGIWNNSRQAPQPSLSPVPTPILGEGQQITWDNGQPSSRGFVETAQVYGSFGRNGHRTRRLTPDSDFMRPTTTTGRGQKYDDHFPTAGGFVTKFGGYAMGPAHLESTTGYAAGNIGAPVNLTMGLYSTTQQPVGISLSPHAREFTSTALPWKTETGPIAEGQTFLPATEPLNYRRLLDRNVTCDWKYIVDKIVCNNDQQASIFLQQKLKVGTPEQKYDIVEAIVAQAYPLMVNRFGNFLVQRCFEHGTPEQVVKIAEAIRGNTLNLSMDPFGCHVVQKAFDSVPEEYKAVMVHELLRRIPDTVIHRYACHVWQKLFELRWTESPPQIMKYVNEALRGMWHEVALGETGSLVVQNIFENCLEEDKRPCIEEVLASIDIVAHGQFGNWCIQHICEHGAPADRSRAIDHVIRYAAEYSMDQFASKVVEKCLKIGGPEFLTRYLDRVCEGRVDRPRIPLIDIASDQYGNYLIQYILTHASAQHREVVAAHIRKHMVSLRGSKFGSRVGMLCTNHAVITRPGPGVGPAGGRMTSNSRFSGGSVYR
ncbi:hypothetical protein VTK73DRAFT_52 [Phialemonium thermophilum]|uniref:PUM-HD domain-containing protein n=1 Tax=Phialemonium thermophilum TaxID=223376 RepID=A0ABR3Y8G4_9PEZI